MSSYENDQMFLKTALRNVLEMLPSSNILTEEVKGLMVDSLAKYSTLAMNKFIKGQKEHGGDIRDRDLEIERKMEHIDTFWYSEAEKWKKKI